MIRKSKRYINPLIDLGSSLLDIEKPCRYTGGEYGRLANKNAPLQMLIAFPDLYEIGMSNQALKLLYNRLNKIPGVSCDRAFAAAPDFEQLLKEKKIPLYGLDTGISLKDIDVLMFTFGYELGATGILSMVDISGIPLHSIKRNDKDPIIIAGGPVVSNPLPYSGFIDAFWIGEAEAGFFDLASELGELKQKGAGKTELLACIGGNPHIWIKGKKKAIRAIDMSFGEENTGDVSVFPVPSMKIVQHHGALEIMRGCPNGCRFCHAGYWYRPIRQKPPNLIIKESEAFIIKGGYREISLSSLSSGDYPDVSALVEVLNRIYADRHVSFQMPSLRVESFSLSILEQISQTRKSGLTFAIETPQDAWQMSINKNVNKDTVVDIMTEAKKHGWRSAKFYFMIGLPLELPELAIGAEGSEEKEIVDFIMDIAHKTRMKFNINIGLFIPKPHTPYQWAGQLDREFAFKKLIFIKTALKHRGHRVNTADTFISTIEGLLSRGDERVGRFIEEAYQEGSRLDAWSEYINKDVWLNILKNNQEIVDTILASKPQSFKLPWQEINSGISPQYLSNEFLKSQKHEITAMCNKACTQPCGVCKPDIIQIKNILQSHSIDNKKQSEETLHSETPQIPKADPAVWRLLFSFKKQESAVFHGHLGLLEIFSMAFNRADIPVMYTKGFNPLVKMEIASPLATGIKGLHEIAALEFNEKICTNEFTEKLNNNLPDGLYINKAEIFFIPGGHKKHSLASLLWGFSYSGISAINDEFVPVSQDKQYRQSLNISAFYITRKKVLARNIITPQAPDNNSKAENKTDKIQEWASYFDVYRYLYPQ